MITETVIVAVVSALAGGGLTRLFTIREARTASKIENSKQIIGMYADIAKRYEELACYRMSCVKRMATHKKEAENA